MQEQDGLAPAAARPRNELEHAALCSTCSKNVPRAARWPDRPGGVPVLREELKCAVHSVAHPNAGMCSYYEREPGTD